MSVLRRFETTVVRIFNDLDTPEHDFVQIIHTDEWHFLALLFLNEEVPPVEGTDVISAFVLVAVRDLQGSHRGT